MAGHASNWFKTGKGKAKGKVFISNATLMSAYGYNSPKAAQDLKNYLHQLEKQNGSVPQGVLDLAEDSPQPGGLAKIGPSIQQEKATEANAALTGTDYTVGYDAKSGTYTFTDGAAGKSSTLPDGMDPVQFATALASVAQSQGDPTPAPKPKKAVPSSAPTPPAPSSWATEPGAQAVIEAQQGGVYYSGSGTEAMLVQAYQAANPGFSMTSAENSVLSDYQGSGYKTLNAGLWKLARAATGEMSVAADTKAARLMQLSKKLGSPFDFTSTRAVRTGHPLHAWAQSIGVGDMYINKGFDSSSLNPNVSPIDGSGELGTRVRFRVPKGAKGIYMNGVPGYSSSHPNEVEWLVPANSSWIVSSRTVGADGVVDVVVELVGQRDFSGATIWP